MNILNYIKIKKIKCIVDVNIRKNEITSYQNQHT